MRLEVEAAVQTRGRSRLARALAGSLLLAAACADEPEDRELYRQALGELSAEALLTCDRIVDEGLRGECRAGAAARMARKDITASREACAAIGDAVWREECFFLAADEAELIGRPALETCAEAGRFADRCTQHAAHRDLAGRSLDTSLGREQLMRARVRDVVASYHPDRSEEDLARMVDAAMAQQLSVRFEEAPFALSACGAAGERVCQMAYGAVLYTAKEEGRLEAACAGEATPEAVAAAGVTPWVAEDPLGPAVFALACGRPPPVAEEETQGDEPPPRRGRRGRRR